MIAWKWILKSYCLTQDTYEQRGHYGHGCVADHHNVDAVLEHGAGLDINHIGDLDARLANAVMYAQAGVQEFVSEITTALDDEH